jgi:hypothetical protein
MDVTFMENWKSKTLTKSHFQSIDETLRSRIEILTTANSNEQHQILKRLRHFYIQKLRNFQFLLNKTAFDVFKIKYKVAFIKTIDNLDDCDTEWFWLTTDSEKFEWFKNKKPDQIRFIQDIVSNLLDDELIPLTNDINSILLEFMEPSMVECYMNNVKYVAF